MATPRPRPTSPDDGPWNRDLLTSKRARAAWRRPARGQSLVEFGLLSILLLTMIAGIIDLGRGVYARTTLSNAVREAVRYGSTDPDNPEGIAAAAQNASAGVMIVAPDDGDPTTEDTIARRFAEQGGVIRCSDRNYAWIPPLRASQPLVPVGLGLGVVAPALADGLVNANTSECVNDFYFRVNGRLANPPDQIPGSGIAGKQLSVTFNVSSNCTNVLASLTAWKTDENGNKILPAYSEAQGGPYGGGEYTLAIIVPNDPSFGYAVEFKISALVPASPTPVPATATPAATATNTPVPPPTATATPRPPTSTPAPTNTPGPPTATSTPRPPTNTPGPTNTPTVTNTPKPTNTPGTPTATKTPRPPTNTPGPTNTPTITPTATNTPLPTNTPTVTNTPKPTNTPTITPTATNTPPSTPTNPGGLGDTPFWNERDANNRVIPRWCDSPRVGNLLTVCAAHDFYLAVPSLIGFGKIAMRECATVDIQSVPESR